MVESCTVTRWEESWQASCPSARGATQARISAAGELPFKEEIHGNPLLPSFTSAASQLLPASPMLLPHGPSGAQAALTGAAGHAQCAACRGGGQGDALGFVDSTKGGAAQHVCTWVSRCWAGCTWPTRNHQADCCNAECQLPAAREAPRLLRAVEVTTAAASNHPPPSHLLPSRRARGSCRCLSSLDPQSGAPQGSTCRPADRRGWAQPGRRTSRPGSLRQRRSRSPCCSWRRSVGSGSRRDRLQIEEEGRGSSTGLLANIRKMGRAKTSRAGLAAAATHPPGRPQRSSGGERWAAVWAASSASQRASEVSRRMEAKVAGAEGKQVRRFRQDRGERLQQLWRLCEGEAERQESRVQAER